MLQLLEEERQHRKEERREKESVAAQAELAKALVKEERRQKETALAKAKASAFKLARLLKAAGATNVVIAGETGSSEKEIASL